MFKRMFRHQEVWFVVNGPIIVAFKKHKIRIIEFVPKLRDG